MSHLCANQPTSDGDAPRHLIYAQVLTNWGSLEKAGNAAAPSAGQVAMWIIAASQWVAGLLYIWTCVAPSLFPGREFS